MHIEKIAWGGWQNCYRLTTSQLELIITADVGARILHCAPPDGTNLFYVDQTMLGQQGGDEWISYGGHRFWLAPEHTIRTYQADNHPVTVQQKDDAIAFTSPIENQTGMQKTLTIRMSQNTATILHTVENHNLWDVECALWGLSVMRSDGVAVLPLPPRGAHGGANLLPTNRLALWAYTDMTDPRWTWGREYILLRQDTQATHPQKIGASVSAGWLAYSYADTLFVKQFPYDAGAIYPDNGCNAELFTNAKMLEVESLGALQTIPAGASATHVETWHIIPDVPTPNTEDDVKQYIMPHVNTAILPRG